MLALSLSPFSLTYQPSLTVSADHTAHDPCNQSNQPKQSSNRFLLLPWPAVFSAAARLQGSSELWWFSKSTIYKIKILQPQRQHSAHRIPFRGRTTEIASVFAVGPEHFHLKNGPFSKMAMCTCFKSHFRCGELWPSSST